MSFCTTCGAPLGPADRFCTTCGAPRTETPAAHGRRGRSPRTARRLLAIAVTVAVVCALALAVGYLAWSSPPGVDPAAVEVKVIP